MYKQTEPRYRVSLCLDTVVGFGAERDESWKVSGSAAYQFHRKLITATRTERLDLPNESEDHSQC